MSSLDRQRVVLSLHAAAALSLPGTALGLASLRDGPRLAV